MVVAVLPPIREARGGLHGTRRYLKAQCLAQC